MKKNYNPFKITASAARSARVCARAEQVSRSRRARSERTAQAGSAGGRYVVLKAIEKNGMHTCCSFRESELSSVQKEFDHALKVGKFQEVLEPEYFDTNEQCGAAARAWTRPRRARACSGPAGSSRRARVLASSGITLTKDDEWYLISKCYCSMEDIEKIKEALDKLTFYVYDFGKKGTKTEIPASSATAFVARKPLISAIAEAVLESHGYANCKSARNRDGSEQYLHITTAGAVKASSRTRRVRAFVGERPKG